MNNIFDQYNQMQQPQQQQAPALGPENDYRQAMALLGGSSGGGGSWQTPGVDYSPMNWQSFSKGDDSSGGGGSMSSLGSIASMFA